jgi:hypothetical protein
LGKASGTDYDTEWVSNNPFDQSLNTTDNVNFGEVNVGRVSLVSGGIGPDIQFGDDTFQSTALPNGTADGNIVTWDAATSTYLSAANSSRSLFLNGTNKTGTTIAKGKAVYISGATGTQPEITLAQANSELSSARTIGITSEAIANNATGRVIVAGRLENVDTSAFSAGNTLYLSASTAGGFQTTLPTQPNHGVLMGYVLRSNANTGVVEVHINNYQELGEQSDVLLTSKTNLDLLSYETSSGLWKNKSFSTLGLLTSSAAASTYAPIVHTHTASQISDSTTAGRALLTAADAAAQRSSLGLGTAASAASTDFAPIVHTHTSADITDFNTSVGVRVDIIVPAASTTVAGKVELATILESHTGSSTTLAVTPDDLAFRIHSGSTLYLTPSDSTATVSGGTTFTDSQGMGTRSGTASASFGMRTFNGNSTNGFNATVGSGSGVSFSKRAILSGKATVMSSTDAGNYAQRVQYGKTQTSTPIGNLNAKGFGIRCTGGGNAVDLLVHDGTTLTAVTSSFTPSASTAFDFQIHSDGAGNVTLYVNGSSVATSANGPTGSSGSLPCVSVESEATAAVSAAANSAFLVCNLRLSFDL